MEPELTGEDVDVSRRPGTFQPGPDPRRNLAGRPVGAHGITAQFHKALKENGVDLIAHILERMMVEDRVLVAMLPYMMEKIGINANEAPPANFTYVEQHYIAGSGPEADSAVGTARMRLTERAQHFMELNYSTPLREADTDTDEPENTNA